MTESLNVSFNKHEALVVGEKILAAMQKLGTSLSDVYALLFDRVT
jgi:hypothetical protein